MSDTGISSLCLIFNFKYSTKIICTRRNYGSGRAFNVPTLIDIPKRVRFIDVAGGFDHTIFLAENGDIYSMGMGTYVLDRVLFHKSIQ